MIRLIYLILLMITGPGFAAVLTQMRPTVQSDRVQITLETDSVPQFKHFGLDNPPRVIVDLMDSRSSSGNLAVGQGEVIGVRAGQSGPRTLRLVVDLKNPVPVKVAEQGGKIVIDVFNKDAKGSGDKKSTPTPTASRNATAAAGASTASSSTAGSGSIGAAPSPTIDYYQPQSFPTPTPYQGPASTGKTTYYSALAATPTPTAGSYGGLGGGYPGTSPGAAPYAATAGSNYGSSYLGANGSGASDGGGSSFFKNTRAALAGGGGGSKKPVELDKWGRPKPSGTPTSDSYNELYGVQVSGEAPPIDTEERPREIPMETGSYGSRAGSSYGSYGGSAGYSKPVQLQGFPSGGGSADPKPLGAALTTALPSPTPMPALGPTPFPMETTTSAFGAIQRPTTGGARTGRAKDRRTDVAPGAGKGEVVVVIDPGHGGKDPGAVSAETGVREKDVALAISQRLRQNLQSRYKVVMTRDSDIYIPLKERVELARRHKADLFISIHADAASSQSSGSSVYMLSLSGASSQLGKQLEKSENTVDMKWGNESGKRYDDELQAMLLNIQQEGTQESSQLLAERVLTALGQVNNLSRREVEMANFVVLRAPDVPSILVETAFISNPSEAQLLATPDYQQKLADSLARGIDQFFREHLPQHLMLKK